MIPPDLYEICKKLKDRRLKILRPVPRRLSHRKWVTLSLNHSQPHAMIRAGKYYQLRSCGRPFSYIGRRILMVPPTPSDQNIDFSIIRPQFVSFLHHCGQSKSESVVVTLVRE